jgi:hypothetical protein
MGSDGSVRASRNLGRMKRLGRSLALPITVAIPDITEKHGVGVSETRFPFLKNVIAHYGRPRDRMNPEAVERVRS